MMKVALFSVALLFAIQLTQGSPVKRDCEGCVHEGQSYAVNDTWTHQCLTYKCVGDGQISLVTRRCVDPNNPAICYAVDATWNVVVVNGDFGHCVDYTCVQGPDPNYLPSPVPSNLQCRYKSSCLADAGSVNIANCFTVTCNVTGNNARSAIINTPGCVGSCNFEPTGATFSAGDEWVYRCVRYTCISSDYYTGVRECCEVTVGSTLKTYPVGSFEIECNTYQCYANGGINATSKGCPDPVNAGQCVPVESVWSDGCFQYECQDVGSRGGAVLTSAGCSEPSDNSCHAVDSQWTVTIPGETYPDTGVCVNKKCTLNGNVYQTETVSRECSLNGVCYALNSTREYDAAACKDVTCYTNARGGITTLFSLRCKDADGVCHAVGSSGFPLIYNGQRCEDCSCSKDGNTLSYSCNYTA